jgi:branched-subunit amino acid ABC-type transport system permease component
MAAITPNRSGVSPAEGSAVLGGLALGIVEVFLRGFLPTRISGLTEGIVFVLLALLFVVRPQGLVTVRRAERV